MSSYNNVAHAAARRSAVVDLGSNSVRLVVFEGETRNPLPIFNERAVLRLGSGLNATGKLNEAGVEQAVTVMRRYHAVARAMHADPLEVLATAAVRDASNGPAFVSALKESMPGVPIHILSGEEEAAFSAEGVLSGIPSACGILADIGGGSLEVVRLRGGQREDATTLKLGVIRLSERAENDLTRARRIAESDLESVDWLNRGLNKKATRGGPNPDSGESLYLVGGAFRALARVHMALIGYQLNIVHHYTIDADAARSLAAQVMDGGRRVLDRVQGLSRKRMEDLPYAALVLRRLLRITGAERVVFSANGLREGWYMRRLPPAIRAQDPLIAATRDLAMALSRDPRLPPALVEWTAPLFPNENEQLCQWREAACWLSDLGSHDHPEYRGEQAYLRIIRQPDMALDHPARVFLGLAVAFRYEAQDNASYLAGTIGLLPPPMVKRAAQLGSALRLAYTLSAGTPDLLAGSRIAAEGNTLMLRLPEQAGVFAGDGVVRRLRRLAECLGLQNAQTLPA